MSKTKIEWADRVWNPVTGCTKVSPGCENCYAERMSKRFAKQWELSEDDPFKVTLRPERLDDPLKWSKPSMVFVCSMSDLFHEEVPFDFIEDVFRIAIQVQSIHTFLFLTKRPRRMQEFFAWIREGKGRWGHFSVRMEECKGIWLGVTAENQEMANERIPILLQTPAAKRFVSVEPMLNRINLTRLTIFDERSNLVLYNSLKGEIFTINSNCVNGIGSTMPATKLEWVICGGESGFGARPMQLDWVRSLKSQCTDMNVPFMFKQWGEFVPCIPNNGTEPWVTGFNCVGVRGHKAVTMDDGLVMERVGKKKAGRLLDGMVWNEYPI